ncbi:hypothetical protein T4B_3208 [Trichinella pseudospiralis]|uniref:Uncharacterized protein n=1 Tax=Trichinella pseudospiralis TaxID=6337 RepID=A0A0V1EY28_TRIPS|nr:hypothetical protein T4A_3517 [Trichinella pseudospiralis]KRZ32024.1 hypothetical protein T4B_3208 [Trichinella pseudospiralis]KRZ46230.1 hypothetical protein T4C_8158 [Trichinella pseudospiralis]
MEFAKLTTAHPALCIDCHLNFALTAFCNTTKNVYLMICNSTTTYVRIYKTLLTTQIINNTVKNCVMRSDCQSANESAYSEAEARKVIGKR